MDHNYLYRDDGLCCCQTCDCLENFTRDCCGRRLTSDELSQVTDGALDFYRGRWWRPIEEPPTLSDAEKEAALKALAVMSGSPLEKEDIRTATDEELMAFTNRLRRMDGVLDKINNMTTQLDELIQPRPIPPSPFNGVDATGTPVSPTFLYNSSSPLPSTLRIGAVGRNEFDEPEGR